jgi:CheY-like chemotaxis protein
MAREPILVVDDSPLNLKLVRVILQGEGYDVHTAGDAEEAMRVMRTFRPRVILTDLHLPGEDGLDLTRRLKREPATKDIVILAVTGCVFDGDEARAFAAGCDGYITKPFEVESLKQVIARHLAATAGNS